MGRPSKLTPQIREVIVDHVKNGGYLSTAAQLAGVDDGTVHRWIAKGGEDGAPRAYRDFRAAIHEAEGELERLVLTKAREAIERGDGPDVRLGLEVLARRQPDKWAPPKVRSEISTPEGGIDVNVTVSARKSLLDALDGMAKRIHGEDDVEDE
jgi:transposase